MGLIDTWRREFVPIKLMGKLLLSNTVGSRVKDFYLLL